MLFYFNIMYIDSNMRKVQQFFFSRMFFSFVYYNGNKILNKYNTIRRLKLQYFLASFY